MKPLERDATPVRSANGYPGRDATIARPWLHDLSPVKDEFRSQVLAGLRSPRKQLPCKFFYDQIGSQLFERICELPEYYPTRTELAILRKDAGEMADAIGPRAMVIEYGSGSSLKTRLLLEKLESPAGYVPLDISREHLLEAARGLSEKFPALNVLPVCADYTKPFALPDCPSGRKVIYFPGSTIGNFDPQDAIAFLRAGAKRCGRNGGLLIGVDLKKDPRLLHVAYNDAAGVTAQFNLNLLARVNRELDGNFDLDQFVHYAFYNPRAGRVEMHLLSRAAQAVRIGEERISFRQGESIFTESSYKYTLAEFEALATQSGWTLAQTWVDQENLFSVQYLVGKA